MTTLKFILLLLLSQSKYCYCQKNNSDSLLSKFRSDIQVLQKEHSGVITMDDRIRESYYLVIVNSSISDLVKYTNDTNAVVRSYIFAGLMRQKVNNKILLKILDQHKNDTAKFTTKSADVVISWTVIEFMHAGMIMKSEKKLVAIDYRKELERIRDKNKSQLQ